VADELQKEECLDVSGERRVFFYGFWQGPCSDVKIGFPDFLLTDF
jgi:hypothetical protein